LKNRWELVIDKRHAGNMINLQVEGKTVGRFKVNRKGKVTVPTRSEEGKKLEEALKKGYDIKVSRIS
jgi:predicted PilT family ATPase